MKDPETDCLWVEAKLIEFLEDSLSAKDRERLSTHLAACERCRTMIENVRSARKAILDLPPIKMSPENLRSWAGKAVENARAALRESAGCSGQVGPAMKILPGMAPGGSGDILRGQEKDIVRQIVREYLQSDSERHLEEFDVAFDSVYQTIQRRIAEKRSTDAPAMKEGVAFDAAMVTGTLISNICWAAVVLARAAADAEQDPARALDQAESKLAAWTRKPESVHKLRESLTKLIWGR